MAELIPFAELRGGLRQETAARADFAVLPLGAVEWHGPHLPFGTDVILASEFAARIKGNVTAVLFPAMPYSACPGRPAATRAPSPSAPRSRWPTCATSSRAS